jgi:Spy/CpxP family protein refolding chaperone
MKRYSIMAVAAIAALIITSMDCSAQDIGHGRWWQRPVVAKELNLTDKDKQILDDMFTRNRDRFIDLKSALDKERLKLDDILVKEPLNEAAAKIQYRRVEEKRQGIADERFRYLLGVRKTLGPERFQRLTGMADEMRKKRFGSEGSDSWDRGYQQDPSHDEQNWNNPPASKRSVSPGDRRGVRRFDH